VETKAHLCFSKKGRGALWVCILNQGGGEPKKFGNHWCRWMSRFKVLIMTVRHTLLLVHGATPIALSCSKLPETRFQLLHVSWCGQVHQRTNKHMSCGTYCAVLTSILCFLNPRLRSHEPRHLSECYDMDWWGIMAGLRKATICFCHDCPSVRMEQFGSHWKDFHKIWYSMFRKSVQKLSFIKIWQEQLVLYMKTYVHLW
jgi:hypothetical protein